VVGYQGLAYALFDPARWEPVEVLRWLKEYVDNAQASHTLARSVDDFSAAARRP